MGTGIDSYLRFLKGDQSGMRAIVELYWDSMLLFTNGYVHNLSDAEDIAQEALIKLSIKRPKLREEPQLRSYLLKICRNMAINHNKKQKRTVMMPHETAELVEDEIENSIEEVENRMQLEHSKRTLHTAMQQLRQDYREVLYLRYFEELSSKEAAAIMHCSEKQVTALAYQARQQLKKILEKEGYSSEEL